MAQSFANVKVKDILFIHDLKNQVVYRGEVSDYNEVNEITTMLYVKPLQDQYKVNTNFVLKINHATDDYIVNEDETAIAYYDMERPITNCMKKLEKIILDTQSKQKFIEDMISDSLEYYKKIQEEEEKKEDVKKTEPINTKQFKKKKNKK